MSFILNLSRTTAPNHWNVGTLGQLWARIGGGRGLFGGVHQALVAQVQFQGLMNFINVRLWKSLQLHIQKGERDEEGLLCGWTWEGGCGTWPTNPILATDGEDFGGMRKSWAGWKRQDLHRQRGRRMDLGVSWPKSPQKQREAHLVGKERVTRKFLQWLISLFCHRFWGDDKMSAFPPKGDGKLVMTADFITIFGLLK